MVSLFNTVVSPAGVTKGARHKLLLSIKKLSERGAVLDALAAELRAGPGGAGRALERLRGVLLSPMPPGGDLPAAIVRALHLGMWTCSLTHTAPATLLPTASSTLRGFVTCRWHRTGHVGSQ